MTVGEIPPAFRPLDLPVILLIAAATLVAWGMVVHRRNDLRPAMARLSSRDGWTRVYSLPRAGTTTVTAKGPLGNSVIELRPDGARFLSSPCPNGICVSRGELSSPGETAACVPNGLLLEVLGDRVTEDGPSGGCHANGLDGLTR